MEFGVEMSDTERSICQESFNEIRNMVTIAGKKFEGGFPLTIDEHTDFCILAYALSDAKEFWTDIIKDFETSNISQDGDLHE